MLYFPNKDINIYLSLLKLLEDPDMSRYINSLRIKSESDDTLNYHIERWETISSKYFRAIESLYRYSSHVYFTSSNVKYISKSDFLIDYYNETGLSQQVRDMILELILKTKKERKSDDFLFGKLSKRIMEIMKKNNSI